MKAKRNMFDNLVPAYKEINLIKERRQPSGSLAFNSGEKGRGVNIDRFAQKQNSKNVARNLFDLNYQAQSAQLKRRHSNSSKQLFAKAHSTAKGQTFLRNKSAKSVSLFKPDLSIVERKQLKEDAKQSVPQQMQQLLSSKLRQAEKDRKLMMKQVMADLHKRQSKLVIKRDYSRLKSEKSMLEQSMLKNRTVSQIETKSKLYTEKPKDSKNKQQISIRQILAQGNRFDRQMSSDIKINNEEIVKTIKDAIRSNIQEIYLQKDRRLQQKYQSKQRQFLQKFNSLQRVISDKLQSDKNTLMESISKQLDKQVILESASYKKENNHHDISRSGRTYFQDPPTTRIPSQQTANKESKNESFERRNEGEEKQKKSQTNNNKQLINKTKEEVSKDRARRPQASRKEETINIFEQLQPLESDLFENQEVKFVEKSKPMNKAAVIVPPQAKPQTLKYKQEKKESKQQSSIFDKVEDFLPDQIQQITLKFQSKRVPQQPNPSSQPDSVKQANKNKIQPKVQQRRFESFPQKTENDNNNNNKNNNTAVVASPKIRPNEQPQKQTINQTTPPQKPSEEKTLSLEKKQQILRKKIIQFQQRDTILGAIGCVAGLCSQNCKQSKLEWRLPSLLTYRYVLDCYMDQIPYYEQAQKLGLISKQISDNFFSDMQKMETNLQKMLKSITKKIAISDAIKFVVTSDENEMHRLRPMIMQQVAKYVGSLKRSDQIKNLPVLQCGLRMINAVYLIRQISDFPHEKVLPADFQSYSLQQSLNLFNEWQQRLQKLS